MSNKRTVRSCNRSSPLSQDGSNRLHRQICLGIEREEYNRIWHDAKKVRELVDYQMMKSPELFPMEMHEKGYSLTGHLPESKKIPGIRLRQVLVGKKRYTLRPSFVMGYMSGTVDELDSPLFLLSLGVPAWAITRVFGRNDLYWHRQVERLGKNSLVGTTVSSREYLPKHIAADEHHGRWCGQKGYVAMTVGSGCILGMGPPSGSR